jgi:carbonyl reductase 1
MTETVLVTGANRGIGLAVSRALVARGYAVVATARSADAAERTAASLASPGLPKVLATALDVTDARSIAELAERVQVAGIRLAALVNNAGASFDAFDAEVATATLETNTFGPMRVADALDSALDSGAKIVNVSSGMGHLSGFGPELRRRFESATTRAELDELLRAFVDDVQRGQHSARGWPSNAYSVSKAALNLFTRILARERTWLRVNSVCPGWVRTDMGGSAASRSVEQGAAGIVWAATLPSDGPTGGFFRDCARIEW